MLEHLACVSIDTLTVLGVPLPIVASDCVGSGTLSVGEVRICLEQCVATVTAKNFQKTDGCLYQTRGTAVGLVLRAKA